MAINTALLVAAPMLQDYLVDNVAGAPMSNGTITLYQDNSRTTLKNWYYQTGSPGAYTYTTLPNPLTLSSIGTICDANGVDTIPFFYPYSETDNVTPQPYYIVVVDSNGQAQFTRQNFPFIAQTPLSAQVPTLQNILINNAFWRNLGSVTLTNQTNYLLCPGAHDGLTNSDIRFLKNITGATDNLTFTKFALGSTPFTNGITPEYYINFNCSALQAGETLKCVQIPIALHVETLESINASVTIWAENVAGNANNTLQLSIYQFLGTGVTSPAPIPIQTITLTNSWQKYVINFTFPTAAGLTLGAGSDDALYLQIGYPLAATCNINFTKPSIYLSAQVPTNDFTNYDNVNAVVSAPRTGDVRTTFNGSSIPFGFIPMNDGTIGLKDGGGDSNATTYDNPLSWQLYSLIWNAFKANGEEVFAPMYNSAATPVSYGANAYADFTAYNAISLTQALGRVMVNGKYPSGQVTAVTNAISGNIITVASTPSLFTGAPIFFTTTGTVPGGLTAATIYYCIFLTATTISVATTAANAYAGTAIALAGNGTGTNTVTARLNGAPFGVEMQELLASQVPVLHTNFNYVSDQVGTDVLTGTGARTTQVNNVVNPGGGKAFPTGQLSVYTNMFIKL